MISFTGSTATGRVVGAAAGRMLKRVVLELGGNSPLVVLDDADVDAAASAGAWGSFLHQGQICLAVSRHLVHERIAEQYLDALTARAKRLPVGNPDTDEVALGPIINERQVQRVQRIVDETVSAGAEALTGGTADGLFYPPTVLAGVTPEMAAFREEIFGPVAPVTTFSSDEEAVALANQTEYGLAASVQCGPAVCARHGSENGSTPGWSTSTTRRSTKSRPHRSGDAGDLQQRRPLRRRRQPGAVDRVAVGHGARSGIPVPVRITPRITTADRAVARRGSQTGGQLGCTSWAHRTAGTAKSEARIQGDDHPGVATNKKCLGGPLSCTAVLEPEARSSVTSTRRRARLTHRPGAPLLGVGRHDSGRAVDRVRLALRAYEQRAHSRAAVLAMWHTGLARRPVS